MTTIELGNVGSKEQAEKIINTLNGQTYMHFEAAYGVYAGNYPVTVSTSRVDTTEDELKDMVLFFLATKL